MCKFFPQREREIKKNCSKRSNRRQSRQKGNGINACKTGDKKPTKARAGYEDEYWTDALCRSLFVARIKNKPN